MNRIVFGTFATQENAERCIHALQSELNITSENLSYLYRNEKGQIEEGSDRVSDIVDSSAGGAAVGATMGAIAGIATVAGVIPFIGPIFAAGPLITALGIGAGALATAATGAVTGAVAGGLVGALVEWGIPNDIAETYQERLNSGEILVAVSTEDAPAAERKFVEFNATSVTTNTPVKN